MPEYVYALHDFLPEHEDEVTFHAGERIEVIEKDDMYGDGWWHGRNLAGSVGLFPVSYTAPVPPATDTPDTASSQESEPSYEPPGLLANNNKSVLQPLPEESESESPGFDILSPVPKHPTTFLNNDYDSGLPHEDDASLNLTSGNNEMMKATMTDVQKAIEQLGREGVGEDGDGARSFSFASTRDGVDTDTDFDLSDLDGAAANGNNGEDWHKGARRKLAATAKRAVEEAEKLEAMMGDNGSGRRAVAPPIEVELSDESDVEDDPEFTGSSNFQRNHPYIPEEDEDIGTDGETTAATNGTQHSIIKTLSSTEVNVLVPPIDENDVPTATKLSFSASQNPVPTESLLEKAEEKPLTTEKGIYPSPISPAPIILPNISTIQETLKRSSTPPREITNGLPSLASVGHNSSKHNSMISSSSAPGMLMPTPPRVQQQAVTDGPSTLGTPASISTSTPQGRSETHPTEWSVEEVVDWLKSKGFDQDVCNKFVEQEITGDVLLELDVNLLKSEIGVVAFGKRMRIANAIAELRRPPIEYSDHQLSPMQLHHSHSRVQSRSQSHHSFSGTTPATTVGHAHSYSMQSSFGSPEAGVVYVGQQSGLAYDSPVNINDDTNAAGPMGMVHGAAVGVAAGMSAAAGVGLGIALAPIDAGSVEKGSPTQSSPSDGALKESAAKTVTAIVGKAEAEDRGHMSDGEVGLSATSMRRRLFGRSHESAISILNSSSRSKRSPLSSPTARDILDKEDKDKDSIQDLKEKEPINDRDTPTVGTRHVRSKKSVDAKHSDRLSIFGTTFGGTLGKSRKPPPSEEIWTEKPSKFSLPRLHSASIRKSSSTASHRPSTSTNGSPKKGHHDFFGIYDEKEKEKEKEKSPAILRKRTNSNTPIATGNGANGNGGPEAVNGVSGLIKQGVNIMDQIGEPDHEGWMRKKGERYNSWKMRYFILKGPHLYYLRSNNKSETRIKGYIHIIGYKVTVDENVDPGRYGFRIDHDNDKTHYFSSEEKTIIRDWMKAMMKATILRDYAKPVMSSCNIPTIPLVVAQAMNPAPRPPSPSARAATQRALRRENTEQLSTRDTHILMGLNVIDIKDERARLDSFFSNGTAGADVNPSSPVRAPAPPRPSRQIGRMNSGRAMMNQVDEALIQWANTHLPESLQITDPTGVLCTGLGLLRLAESIKGRPSSPPILDSSFPTDINDDKLDGLFKLFDFLLDNEVKMGSVSINDVRLGKRDKIIQLLKALKAWEDKRKALSLSIARATGPAAFMTPAVV